MRNRVFDWILFDLDGTLVDSLPALYNAYRSFLKEHSVSATKEEFRSLNGPSIPNIVRILKKKHSLKESHTVLLDQYSNFTKMFYERDASEYPSCNSILKKLYNNGYKMGLVTTSMSSIADPFVRRKNWHRMLRSRTYGDEVLNGKPDPEIYKRALKKIGAHPSRVLVLEDSVNGVTAAKRAGAYVVGIARNRDSNRLTEAGADKIILDLKDLTEIANSPRLPILSKGIIHKVTSLNVIKVPDKGPSIKNLLFTAEKLSINRNQARILGKFINYEDFMRTVRSKTYPGFALGVSGVTTVGSRKNKLFLIGRRSNKVRIYKNTWEFVPSGCIDQASSKKSLRIDFKKVLSKELLEESGIPKDTISSIRPIGIYRDPDMNIVDICCEIILKQKSLSTIININRSEYSKMRFVSLKDVMKIFSSNKHKIMPLAREILKYYLKN